MDTNKRCAIVYCLDCGSKYSKTIEPRFKAVKSPDYGKCKDCGSDKVLMTEYRE